MRSTCQPDPTDPRPGPTRSPRGGQRIGPGAESPRVVSVPWFGDEGLWLFWVLREA